MVFEANAVAIGNDDHRFVREAHAGAQDGFVAAHQIGGLVDGLPDTMAGAMRQAGKPVSRPQPRPFEHLSGRGIDPFAGFARADRRECCGLRLVLEVPGGADGVVDPPEGVGAGNIGMIAVDEAARVDQNELILLERLIAGQPMGEGGRATELHRAERRSGGAERAVGIVDETPDGTGADAGRQDARGAALIETVAGELDAGFATMPQPMMGAEDFSYVLRRYPGAFAFLGVAPAGSDPATNPPLHNTRMTIDESVMAKGVAIHCAVATRYLERGFD